MENMSVDNAIAEIERYMEGSVRTPFFIFVDGGAEYTDITRHLFSFLSPMYTSAYCDEDSYPDYDRLCDELKSAAKSTVLLGLGESVYLGGTDYAIKKVKDLYCRSKAVVLCRGVRHELQILEGSDVKFDDRKYCKVESDSLFEVVLFQENLDVPIDALGFRQLLEVLEKGAEDYVIVKSRLALRNVRRVDSAYAAILFKYPDFRVSGQCLSEEQWISLLGDTDCAGYPVTHWRTYLKCLLSSYENNPYIKLILKKVSCYEEYQDKLLTGLLDISHKEKGFWELYRARKELVRELTNGDIADYVSKTTIYDDTRIYYLTDNTAEERRTIIEELSKLSEIPEAMDIIYPALYDYLHNYQFKCKNSEVFNPYFTQYKLLKLRNYIDDSFKERIAEMAQPGRRAYNVLETRGSLVEKYDQSKDILFWLDGLGVEYLGYIQKRANALGLGVLIHIGRSELPTITSVNREFYDNWHGHKHMTRKLDDIKHNKGEYPYKGDTPIYLEEELRVIDEQFDWIKTELEGKRATKVILVSDHGASRLAVLCKSENIKEMSTKGKYSGRCCPSNEIDEQPNCATEEHGFWVLANYDRFRGGRAADIEVHGGASLEEVLVPVIEISLKNASIDIENRTPVIWADNFDTIPEIKLFSSYVLEDVSVYFNGKHYPARKADGNPHYHYVAFNNYRKAGKYTADVYTCDDFIGQVAFEIVSKSGQVRDDDDFFSM